MKEASLESILEPRQSFKDFMQAQNNGSLNETRAQTSVDQTVLDIKTPTLNQLV